MSKVIIFYFKTNPKIVVATKLKNVFFFRLGMEDTEEEMSDSLANQQENNRSQSSGEKMRSKQPSDWQRRGENYGADSEENFSEPKGKVSVSKSKVNSFVFF